MKNIEFLSKIILFSPIFIFSLARLGEEFRIFRPGFLHDELIYLPLLIPVAVIGMLISTPSTTNWLKIWKIINFVILAVSILIFLLLALSAWGHEGIDVGEGIAMLGLFFISIPLLFISGLGLSITRSLSAEPNAFKSFVVLSITGVILFTISIISLF